MNALAEMPALSGLEQIRAVFSGRAGYEGIVKMLGLHPVSADEGFDEETALAALDLVEMILGAAATLA